MKVCVLQPEYSFSESDGERCFAGVLDLLYNCDESMDVIVLPEYGDLPYNETDPERFVSVAKRNGQILQKTAEETARRCGATVFFNRFDFTPSGMRNTTFAVDKNGDTVGKYVKEHPAPSEERSVEDGGHGLDVSYSYSYRRPEVITVNGVRYGFVTCFDSYFYEYYPQIARQNVDVIIACSLQRTDSQDILETFGKFLSYNTNSYLLRSSVSLGEGSTKCGCSMVIAPDGEVLLNMKSKIGLGVAEIDVQKKFTKPAGFNGVQKPHYVYAEVGRRPWLYRPAGSFIVPNDVQMPYPRLCAYGGLGAVAPENSLPALGAAIALGAKETGFDVMATRDGELVLLRSPETNGVSDGAGNVCDLTYEELLKFDFGIKHGEAFQGLRIVRLEEVLCRFARQTVMNINVKIWNGECKEHYCRELGDLIEQYDCQEHVCVMAENPDCLEEFHSLYPEIHRCLILSDKSSITDAALAGIEKVQLERRHASAQAVRDAHEKGLRCSVFCKNLTEAEHYLEIGVDCVFTDDFLRFKNRLNK